LCAVIVSHLRKGAQAEEFAREQVSRVLRKLREDGTGGPYVDQALEYLSTHWEDEIKPRLLPRKSLVRIVRTFLYSIQVETELRGETQISGGASEHEGYKKRAGYFDPLLVDNPLRFLEIYTGTYEPSASHSMWMLYNVAFSSYNK
jgi:hypothetical protein